MKPLVVDQALHGYRDGHELLASSFQVPRDARRTLLAMSDLSGPGFIDGFDGYLTGYPISALSKYALARTWYAPELERPGCVWTHTLLVDFSDVPSLESLSILVDYFRQPRTVKKTAAYEERLSVSQVDSDRSLRAADEIASYRLLEALYGGDHAPVLIRSSRVGQIDDLIFAIWAQQWPRLRRSFSFCTGAFSLRAVDDTPLDLQIVPSKRWARVLRSDRSAHAVELVQDTARSVEGGDWLTVVATDLGRSGSPLRSYLREYGADAPGSRTSFRSLAQCFLLQERVRRGYAPLDQLVAAVGEGFPDKSSAARLKRDLLGPEKTRKSDLAVSESARILAALRTNYESSFDVEGLCIEERALRLMRSETETLNQILASPVGRTGRRVIDGVLSEIDVERLRAFFETDEALFERVLLARPSLFYEQDLWRAPRHLQRECMALAGREAASLVDVSRLLEAALSAGTNAVIGDVDVLWGEQVVHAALAWVDGPQMNDRGLGEPWRELLRSRLAETVEWFGTRGTLVRPETLQLLPDLAQPSDPMLDRLPTARLGKWAARVCGVGDSNADVDLLAFLLAIGLCREGRAVFNLVAAAFPGVHEALLQNQLGWKAWSWLEPLMPSKDWFFSRDWDKADKLRRALFVRIAGGRWPAECLGAAAYSKQTRRYLKKTAATSRDWARIARRRVG